MLLSLAAGPALVAFGAWRIFWVRVPTAHAIGSLSVGAGLLVLAMATYVVMSSSYRNHSFAPLLMLLPPVAAYAAVFVITERKYSLSLGALLLSSALGLALLALLGVYLFMVVACGVVGECL
jgi:hypothetical protein